MNRKKLEKLTGMKAEKVVELNQWWEDERQYNNRTSVCIAIPSKDMLHTAFAYCLQDLVYHNARRHIESFVEFNMGTLVCNQREALAKTALQFKATHILFIDSDMMFPRDICERLLAHNKPIVACNYSTRVAPFKSVAYKELYNWDSYVDPDEEGLIKVKGVGMGCMLIDTRIFKRMTKPWFPITFEKDTDDYLGEDMNFCLAAQKLGLDIWLDCDASQQIHHIGQSTFSWHTAREGV
jgi:hypothetical protein